MTTFRRSSATASLFAAFDACSDEVYVVAPDTGRLLHANRTACANLGYSAEEIAGLAMCDVEPGFAAASGAEAGLVSYQTHHRRRDGTLYPVESRRLAAADCEPLVVFAVDLSETRRREGELARISRAMTALTRASEAMMRATDERDLLNEVCRIVVEVGGYRLSFVCYKRDDPEQSLEPVARFGIDDGYVAAARISWGDNERGRGPAGTAARKGVTQVVRNTSTEERFAPWREQALRHGFASVICLPMTIDGAVLGVLNIYAGETDAFDADEVGLLQDLARNLSYGVKALRAQADRRRAESRLKESEARYRALVELSPDAILVIKDGRTVYANAAAHRIFGVPEGKSLIGRDALALVADEDKPRVAERLGAPAQSTGLVEEKLLRWDGEAFDAEVSATPVPFHGGQARQVVIRDVTERKVVQAQLVQAAKLATLGEMAAGMAHELSQPLNIIRMAAEGALLLTERGKASESYKDGQFRLIADQTRRMAEIIDHIRIFSRKDAGHTAVFDAVRAVRMAAGMMENQLRADSIELALSLPAGECPVRGRPVQLEQVIINLIGNAADAIREKRRLAAATAGRIQLTMTASDELGVVWIVVSDNGPGIRQAILDRIFEPFFTTKEVGRGTGLGLSVSFGIVSSMNGRLDACNNKEGASFVVTLPIAARPDEAAQGRPSAPEAPHREAPRRRILVVDDEPEAARAMAAYLEEVGYSVAVAGDGEAGWALFSAEPADLVITDLRMPHTDGHRLIQRLRGHDPLLPIIVVTGDLGRGENSEELEDELAVILKKPVGLKELAETVERFFEEDEPRR